jgi:hypothetical protein
MGNENGITEKTKISLPISVWVVMIIFIVSVIVSATFSYSNLVGTDKENKQCIEKKLDKEIFEQYKYQQSVDQKELNRKLDLMMKHFQIKDYGQEVDK